MPPRSSASRHSALARVANWVGRSTSPPPGAALEELAMMLDAQGFWIRTRLTVDGRRAPLVARHGDLSIVVVGDGTYLHPLLIGDAEHLTRALQASDGGTVIGAVLCSEQALNAPARAVAERAGVHVGPAHVLRAIGIRIAVDGNDRLPR